MDVTLLVHLEVTDGRVGWWAESPEIPGFSAAEEGLNELITRATWAVADIVTEELEDELGDVTVELVGREATTGNPVSAGQEPASTGGQAGVSIATPDEDRVPSAA